MSGLDGLTVKVLYCRNLENSKRGQVIMKPLEAIAAYRQMLLYYVLKTIAFFLDSRPEMNYNELHKLLDSGSPKERITEWVNFGGQITPAFRVDELRKDIRAGKYKNWDEIHNVYALWDKEYELDKCRHAWSVLLLLQGTNDAPDANMLKKELATIHDIRYWIDKQIYESRAKDYRNPFKKATFRNTAEMEAVLGIPSDNPFICIVRKESEAFHEMIDRVIARLKVLYKELCLAK
jgi:hypothetical protein